MTVERRHVENKQSRVTVQRNESGPNKIVGYAAVFYREGQPGTEFRLWDDFYERIARGAFDRAISEKHDARGLFNHDMNHVLGRSSAGTLAYSADEVGLRYEIELPDTSTARDLLTSIERGDITGSSFAFIPSRTTWTEDEDRVIRTIEDLDLYDVGPVTFPAYEATSTGVRSSERNQIEQEVEDWRKSIRLERGKKLAKNARARAIELDNQETIR